MKKSLSKREKRMINMNKNLVMLLTSVCLVTSTIPALAVSGPFGYDLQKDINRNSDKPKQDQQQQQQQQKTQQPASVGFGKPEYIPVSDSQIFNSSVTFNKAYYPNASMKSAVSKYKRGNYTGCLQELYTIIKRNPKNAMAYYYAAMAYTKIGAKDNAAAAYQRVINLQPSPVIAEYAAKGKDCLTGGPRCSAGATGNENVDELDKFIAAPYGNGLSPEMNKKYMQQQLEALQNKVNSGKSLTPEELQRLRRLENNQSSIVTGEKLAMADNKSMPSNEEVLGALDVLKRAGLNISAKTYETEKAQSTPQVPVQTYTPDTQIQQMSMMLNGNTNSYNNDPMMTMLPYMMQTEGDKKVDPQLIQAMMMNSMMNSLNGMNMNNNNN